MRIYTKTGDRGTTSLFGGKRVDKNSARIRAYGEVDELNSMIGVIISNLRHSGFRLKVFLPEGLSRIDSGVASLPRMTKGNSDDIEKKLLRVQTELFVLGADLATPNGVSTSLKLRGASKIPRVTKSFIIRLEKEIDKWSASLPQLRKFILPGGGKTGSKLHLARTVARRAERSIVDLSTQEKVNPNAMIFVNRMSDWFFTLARYINKLEKEPERIWKGRG